MLKPEAGKDTVKQALSNDLQKSSVAMCISFELYLVIVVLNPSQEIIQTIGIKVETRNTETPGKFGTSVQ